ncbi:MAG: Rid family detoxifying hydrolase [Buchnera aphidicola (Nurudea yanoniella)]
MNIEKISNDILPKPIGPYSTAIHIENLIFISGQISNSIDSKNEINNIDFQTRDILKNIKNILKKYNANIANIIKTTLFITDLKNLKIINEIYEKFFLKYSTRFPTRSCIEISKLPKNSLIEIEAIAYKK